MNTEFEEESAPRKNKRSLVSGFIAIFLIFGLVAGGLFAASSTIQEFLTRFQVEDYSGEPGPVTQLVISEGENGEDVARSMVEADIIQSFDAIYRDMLNVNLVIFPGTYEFPTKLSGSAALALLMQGNNRVTISTTIPEGFTVAQILLRVQEDLGISPQDMSRAFESQLQRLPDGLPTIEGYLFPATYSFDPNPDADEVVTAMVDRMESELSGFEITLKESFPVVVLASVIQAEGMLREDFYKISRVFTNRLERNIALQSDPTVKYRYEGSLDSFQEGMKDTESLFNTYAHPGIPLGPISNPGALAIEAALRPAIGDWLYFVSINLDTGETIFSETLAQHEKAADLYRQWLRDNP